MVLLESLCARGGGQIWGGFKGALSPHVDPGQGPVGCAVGQSPPHENDFHHFEMPLEPNIKKCKVPRMPGFQDVSLFAWRKP